MRLFRLVLFTVAAAGLCWAGAMIGVLAWGGSSSAMCSNEPLAEAVSPGAKLKAIVFRRNCGATTAFGTEVSVIEAGATLPNEPGNVFSADTDHGAAPSAPGGGPVVDARWRSASRLYIAHDARARVFLAERKMGDVQIDHGADAH